MESQLKSYRNISCGELAFQRIDGNLPIVENACGKSGIGTAVSQHIGYIVDAARASRCYDRNIEH